MVLTFVLIGVAAGILAGLFGIGGGILIVPALIYFGGMAFKTATGTSLGALLLPVGLLAALTYWRARRGCPSSGSNAPAAPHVRLEQTLDDAGGMLRAGNAAPEAVARV